MNRNDWEKQIFASNLNTTARMVAIALGSFGNWVEDKTVWPSMKGLADMAGISRDSVKKYVEAFEQQGWLEVVKVREKNVKEYRLLEVHQDSEGILSKTKKSMSTKQLNNLKGQQLQNASATDSSEQLQNLSATEENQLQKREGAVAETRRGSCRNSREAVAEPICTNLQENLPDRNLLEEPTTTSPDGPVEITSSNLREEETVYLTMSERRELGRIMVFHKTSPNYEKELKRILEAEDNERRRVPFPKRVDDAILSLGLTLEDEW